MLAKQQSAWPFLVFHQKWTLVEGKGAFQTQTGLYLSEKKMDLQKLYMTINEG